MNFITDLFTFTESLEFIRSLKLIAVRLVLFSMLGGSISLTRRRGSSGVSNGVGSCSGGSGSFSCRKGGAVVGQW